MANVAVLTNQESDLAQASAERVVRTHEALAEFLRAGITLAEVDLFVAETLSKLDSKSCFLGYRVPRTPPFQAHSCLSVNECVVHGRPMDHEAPLVEGDLLSVDIGVLHRGWIGDAAWTYSIGEPTEEVGRLMACGRESIRRGVAELRPGNRLIEWARAVQGYVEGECGFHLVRGLGGHGYGRKLHGPPFVSNVVPSYPGEWPDGQRELKPGMLLAVEPMIAVGTGDIRQTARDWPIYSGDGSMSVHYEHDVLIGEDGPLVLTAGLEALPDVVGA